MTKKQPKPDSAVTLSKTQMRSEISMLRRDGKTWEEIYSLYLAKDIVSQVTGKNYTVSGLKAIYHGPNRKRRKAVKLMKDLAEGVKSGEVKDTDENLFKDIDPKYDPNMPPDKIWTYEWTKQPSTEKIFLKTICDILDQRDYDEGANLSHIRTVIDLWKQLEIR